MTAITMNFASPRLLLMAAGAVKQIAEVLGKFGLSRPLVVTDPFMVSSGHVRHCLDPLTAAGLAVSVFSDTVPDPTDTVIEAGVAELNKGDFDCLIGFGGGSPLDTAKAMAILAAGGGKMRDYKVPLSADRGALPVIAIPTTAGTGSECTRFTVITDTERDEKMLIAGLGALPLAALVDYELTYSVPPRTTADTGVDSLTHALEAFVSKRANPLSDALALSAMALIGGNIRTAYAEPRSGAAAVHGLAAVAIRRSGHIGCLAAYVERIAERGQMLLLASSDPSTASVAPFGGTRRMITPNPLAAGWPTEGAPVVMDVSTSITTNGMTARLASEGRKFGYEALLDADGRATSDPAAFFADPPGTLLPLGGVEAGHKGYALGLLIEALTSGLAGHGRADMPARWGASVFVQVIDPARFGGSAAFAHETEWLAAAARENPAADAAHPPRMPGERALRRKAEQLQAGVTLHPAIMPVLAERASRAGLEAPPPLA